MSWLQRLFGKEEVKEFGVDDADELDIKNVALAESLAEKMKQNGGEVALVEIIVEAGTQATLNAVEFLGYKNVVAEEADAREADYSQSIADLTATNVQIVETEKTAAKKLKQDIIELERIRAAEKAESEATMADNNAEIGTHNEKKDRVNKLRKYARQAS